MRCDPHNMQYFFNEEMILSGQGEADYKAAAHYYWEQVKRDPFGALIDSTNVDPDKRGTMIKFYIMGFIIFAMIGVSLIWCIPIKRYDIAGWMLAAVFAAAGIAGIIFSDVKVSTGYNGLPVMNRIIGVIAILGAIGLIPVQLGSGSFEGSRHLMMIGFVIVIDLFFVFTALIISIFLSNRYKYTANVDALCIGYLRTFESYGMDSHTPPTVSPVFEYNYEGQKITACYDEFYIGVKGEIPVGSRTTIAIDPNEPASIKGNHRSNIPTAVIFALLLLIGAVILGWMLFFT